VINESRAKNGTLTLTAGAPGTPLDVSCQVTNVRISTSYSDDGDAVTTLCGDTKSPPRKLDGHKLAGTIIQDFDLAEADGGVIDFLWNHSLELVDFEFVPDDLATAPTVTGKLTVEIPGDSYGGDVGSRLTSDFEWSIDGAPLRTYPAADPARAERGTAEVAA
jgi:hypothetical protein